MIKILPRSRSVWFSLLLLLICIWTFFRSSTTFHTVLFTSTSITTGNTEEVTDASVDPAIDPDTLDASSKTYSPGEAIPASDWSLITPEDAGPVDEAFGAPLETSTIEVTQPGDEVSQDSQRLQSDDEQPLRTSLTADMQDTRIPSDRPLITYAYVETEFGRRNLQFFVDHGLHDAADFVFILNGKTDAETTIIFNQTGKRSHDRSNVRVVKRPNTCFDLGAHAEVLSNPVGGEGWFGPDGPITAAEVWGEDGISFVPLKDQYKKFILMNASIRGPFVPPWSKECWSNAYLRKVTDRVKLVGMSYNCYKLQGHVQSMIWATDSIGLAIILTPAAIGECFAKMRDAKHGEVRTTKVMRDAGYEVDVFLSVYHSKDKETRAARLRTQGAGESAPDPDTDIPGDFYKNCTDVEYLGAGRYFGSFVHPYENMFMKSHRHIEDNVMDHLTEWHDGMGYESYDVCR